MTHHEAGPDVSALFANVLAKQAQLTKAVELLGKAIGAGATEAAVADQQVPPIMEQPFAPYSSSHAASVVPSEHHALTGELELRVGKHLANYGDGLSARIRMEAREQGLPAWWGFTSRLIKWTDSNHPLSYAYKGVITRIGGRKYPIQVDEFSVEQRQINVPWGASLKTTVTFGDDTIKALAVRWRDDSIFGPEFPEELRTNFGIREPYFFDDYDALVHAPCGDKTVIAHVGYLGLELAGGPQAWKVTTASARGGFDEKRAVSDMPTKAVYEYQEGGGNGPEFVCTAFAHELRDADDRPRPRPEPISPSRFQHLLLFALSTIPREDMVKVPESAA